MATGTGGQILVQGLRELGVERVFGVPGESYLPVLDALVDAPGIRFITCRQEGGAAMMAEAHGKLTGRPGVCFVTRGPGATNASSGVHVAFQDSTPMILFIGQVNRGERDREAFQEVDYRQMFGALAKWSAEIDSAARIPEYLGRAWRTALSGRPGPVVLALPEDVLTETAVADGPLSPEVPVQAPAAADMARLAGLLATAARPMVLVGEGLWSTEARERLQDFARTRGLPVAAAFRCQDRFDNAHPCYVGDVGLGINPELAARVGAADLLLVVGSRLGEIVTGGYTLLQPPMPVQRLVHVHPGAGELGRVYQAELYLNAGVGPFCEALAELPDTPMAVQDGWLQGARDAYLAWTEPTTSPGPLQLATIVRELETLLPPEAIICNGAGNYAIWLHRFHRYRTLGSQLAPRSGSMGYGLPAAIAASLARPECPVVAFAGDGCFQMTMQEFGTAVQHGASVVVVVVNNGAYGTIRMHQERHYPARVSATELVNPDFVELARAYGGYGERVHETGEFAAALGRARASGMPALLELVLPLEALTPRATLSEIRAQGQAGSG